MTLPTVPLKRAGIDRGIAWLHQTGDLRLVPLMRAVRDCGVGLVALQPGERLPNLPAAIRKRPIIVLVHDDVEASAGPGAFDSRALRWLMARAGAALVACAYPPVAWYEACAMAAAVGRLQCGRGGQISGADSLPDRVGASVRAKRFFPLKKSR